MHACMHAQDPRASRPDRTRGTRAVLVDVAGVRHKRVLSNPLNKDDVIVPSLSFFGAEVVSAPATDNG